MVIHYYWFSHNSKSNSWWTPIKCQWRRIKSESERINIKNINSLSYILHAEDIGFWLEVEVESIDDSEDIAIAKYGPINVDNETKNINYWITKLWKKMF